MEQDKIILLVEDSADDEALTLRALRKHGVATRIDVARNGADALDYLFAEGEFKGRDPTQIPRLVLLDLKLPKVDGLEVLRRIKADERTRRIPVAILTTSRQDRDVAAAYDLGANSYIRKPVDFQEFSEAVRTIGVYWLVMNLPSPEAGT